MSGIYIHIPFCKSRCKYCDFYSNTNLQFRDDYVAALICEINDRKHYLTDNHINTIYLGGGTPSLLPVDSILLILNNIKESFDLANDVEITLEANPGDLTEEYLRQLKAIGINRLTIGIQSFDNSMLSLIGRRHTAEQAVEAVKNAREAGFNNISIDLIYGLPGQTLEAWQKQLNTALTLDIQHISTYCLSYEEGTPLTKMLEAKEIEAIDDLTENQMYEILVNTLKNNGFVQYEVSNFSKSGMHSRHNSAYWDGTEYLGIGAAAHSYNGVSRQWNKSDIIEYIRTAKEHCIQPETEILTEQDKYNECVMLSLRTTKGINLNELTEKDKTYCLHQAKPFIQSRLLVLEDNRLTASLGGINILNYITEHLMQ